jgi:hypothetical protein
MRIAKEDVPVKIDVPGAVARQKTEFGDATGYSKMGGEYFSLGAGTDLTPLLHGLEGDMCQCPHWGYILDGSITAILTNSEQELTNKGDLFYWPPGHTIKTDEGAEFILFSPQEEHSHVMNHVLEKVNS